MPLERYGGNNDVYLRQNSSTANQRQSQLTVNASGLFRKRPDADVLHQRTKFLAVARRVTRLLNSDFEFTKHGDARAETIARPRPTHHRFSKRDSGCRSNTKVIRIEKK